MIFSWAGLKSVIPFLILCLYPTSLFATAFEIDLTADTAYLPYKSVEARNMKIQQDCSYPENNVIEVIRPAITGKREGLLILANNPPPADGWPSMFTPRTFPGFVVTDDDPIQYVITNWKSFILPSDSNMYVAGVCHNDDSIFAFKLHIDTDSIDYCLLYTREPSDAGPVVPFINVLYVGDFGAYENEKILLNINYHAHFKRLYLLDLKSLELEWEKPISSGVNPSSLAVLEHPDEPRIMFSTANPANGLQDSDYNDYYSYLTILDTDGDILLNKISGHYGYRPSVSIPANDSDQFFITHYLDLETGDSTGTKAEDEYFISRIDSWGEVLKSVSTGGTPMRMWLMHYGDDQKLKLFVLFASKAVAIYDCDLSLIVKTDPLETALNYLGKYKIAGENDSVFVLGDGLYDSDFNKLMQYPFPSAHFIPIEYDSLGNLSAYVITEYMHYYIGYIEKRTNIELASVLYHRNRNYVLMFLTGLLVALVTTNIFRKRSAANLKLISKQKVELEETHQALQKAQDQIVAQEKFEQAKDIAGGFAHEIRNALSPARNALSRLLPLTNVSGEDEKRHSLADLSNRGVIKALELTQQISNYTKLESMKNPESVKLSDVIDDVLKSYRKVLEDNQIVVTWDRSGDIPLVRANRDQLRIVITNMVSNGIDAMQASAVKQLGITCHHLDGAVELSVTDSGCGIPKESVDRVFDFFYSTKPDSGTGIGLALSKKIVELYGGTISVDCSQSGQTTFRVRFLRIS